MELITNRLCLIMKPHKFLKLLGWWTHARAGRVVHSTPGPGGTSSPHGAAGPGPLWPCLGLPLCRSTQPTGRESGKCWQVTSLEAALSTKGRAQVGTSASCPSTGNPEHTWTKPRCPQRMWLTARAIRPPTSRTSLRTSSREMPALESLQSVRCRDSQGRAVSSVGCEKAAEPLGASLGKETWGC